MSDLRGPFENAIVQSNLLARGESVLVGVSGGADSIVLLHLLTALADAWGWTLTVAHLNHQLRGSESDADEAFVRGVADQLGLPLNSAREDVGAMAAKEKISVEMAARRARHGFLARAARELGMRKVALAHQANDQVELFFLRLLRGAGPEGLAGMKACSPSPCDPEVQLVRPMLGFTREEIAAWARARQIAFRHDASNDELGCERNRIRLELLPFLRQSFGASVDKTVLRLMDISRAESAVVAEMTQRAMAARDQPFHELPRALQRRWLQAKCLALGLEPSFDVIEALRCEPDVPRMVGPGLVIWRDHAGEVHQRELKERIFSMAEAVISLEGPSTEALFSSLRLSWKIMPWSGSPGGRLEAERGLERFDADRIGSKIRLRHWQPGDRFQPIGAAAPVKVQDLLTNLKVPAERRVKLIVAEAEDGEIFWIEGVRISELFKLGPGTQRCLEWRWAQAE